MATRGSGFTALFEALALALCKELPVLKAARLLRCADKQLWGRIKYYVDAARALDGMSTVIDFAADLKLHGGSPEEMQHVCQDMSAAYAKGVGLALFNAAISYGQLHVVAMAVNPMDKVLKVEMREK